MPPEAGSTVTVSTQRVADLVEAVASEAPAPGGGAVAGVAAAFAAALASMAGHYALKREPGSGKFPVLVERANSLATRALELATEDAEAYSRYLSASRMAREPDPEPRRAAVRAALDAAAEVPYELGRLAAEVAAAGEELAISGNPNLVGDAASATFLASAAANGAALMVYENLRRSRPDDPRIAESAGFAAASAAAASRLVARFGAPPPAPSSSVGR